MFLDKDYTFKLTQKQQNTANRHIYEQMISPEAHKRVLVLLKENPELLKLSDITDTPEEFTEGISEIARQYLSERPEALAYYNGTVQGRAAFEKLNFKDVAAIRMLDYIEYSGKDFEDPNRKMEIIHNEPFNLLWFAVKFGKGGVTKTFMNDMLFLFRQFNGTLQPEKCSKEKIRTWMDRHPSGLDEEIIKIREENKNRILWAIIRRIDAGKIVTSSFTFSPGISDEQKYQKALEWWENKNFHLRFAIRSPELLNEMLGYSLQSHTMQRLNRASELGIPFFVNPYYLSLLNIKTDNFTVAADMAIRDYVLYSEELLDEYGSIVAWEKEDIVEPGKPNEAGWLLPNETNIHRRYPEVAILIPDTMGRACGGLCASCQRMYDFQSGNLNFNLKKLKPGQTWEKKLTDLLDYFENDAQLRDILITGGDALMSSDFSIKQILDAVYAMAKRKTEANKKRKDGEKYAEMLRIRLGTRLPVYLPQRITPELVAILKEFREKAQKIGFKQFVIQTHFETAMEITPRVKKAIHLILSAGWIVTNQLVFTAAASRRGHTAKLRRILNEIGVLPYYTFTVKGYMENRHNFATNARAVQEQLEEKVIGLLSNEQLEHIYNLTEEPQTLSQNINKFFQQNSVPFLATDRNLLNLPGVGKSLTFRTIGLTHDGRRILLFDHDSTREHSPVIDEMGKVPIIESKSITAYLEQIKSMGEDTDEYLSIYGYSIGETEPRFSLYNYPEYDFSTTTRLTNFSN